MKRFSRKQKGFSLGEVLLSAFVLSVGVMSSVLLIGKSITYSVDAREATTAAGLAEEGIELVRYVRNRDFLIAGHDGFNDFASGNRFCRIDYTDPSTFVCTSSRSAPSTYYLQYDDARNLYRHVSSSREKYSRALFVSYNPGQQQATVRSFVYWDWTSGSMPSFVPTNGDPSDCTLVNKCVYTEGILTKWQ
jgi:Tfp pilus assembly protein PilV